MTFWLKNTAVVFRKRHCKGNFKRNTIQESMSLTRRNWVTSFSNFVCNVFQVANKNPCAWDVVIPTSALSNNHTKGVWKKWNLKHLDSIFDAHMFVTNITSMVVSVGQIIDNGKLQSKASNIFSGMMVTSSSPLCAWICWNAISCPCPIPGQRSWS